MVLAESSKEVEPWFFSRGRDPLAPAPAADSARVLAWLRLGEDDLAGDDRCRAGDPEERVLSSSLMEALWSKVSPVRRSSSSASSMWLLSPS